MISAINRNAMCSAATVADSDVNIKTSMHRLSTGSRVNSVSDDTALNDQGILGTTLT